MNEGGGGRFWFCWEEYNSLNGGDGGEGHLF